MKAIISTIMTVKADRMWKELQKTSSLVYVASPVLIFKSQDGAPLPSTWQIGKEYRFKLYAFHLLPLGRHRIVLKRIDAKKMEIFSNESGSLLKIWNHLLRVEPLDAGRVRYTDAIEIDAGMLTGVIWLFAHFFYRHRQLRWKRLLAK